MHYPNVHKLATTSSQQCSKHACVLTKTRFCTFCAKLHEARTQQRLLPLLVSMNRLMGGFLVRGGTSEQTVQNLMEKQLAREAAAAVTARAERIGRTAAKAAARDLLTEDAAGRRARAAAGAQAAMAAAGNMLAAAADDEEEDTEEDVEALELSESALLDRDALDDEREPDENESTIVKPGRKRTVERTNGAVPATFLDDLLENQ